MGGGGGSAPTMVIYRKKTLNSQEWSNRVSALVLSTTVRVLKSNTYVSFLEGSRPDIPENASLVRYWETFTVLEKSGAEKTIDRTPCTHSTLFSPGTVCLEV